MLLLSKHTWSPNESCATKGLSKCAEHLCKSTSLFVQTTSATHQHSCIVTSLQNLPRLLAEPRLPLGHRVIDERRMHPRVQSQSQENEKHAAPPPRSPLRPANFMAFCRMQPPLKSPIKTQFPSTHLSEQLCRLDSAEGFGSGRLNDGQRTVQAQETHANSRKPLHKHNSFM